MKHTKNILKSLLITVMALSLLAVSCKKDEGGSKPTDPTPKNSEALLTDMLIGLGALPPSNTVIDFNKIVFDGNGGATIGGADKSYAKVKDALEPVLKVDTFNKEKITLTVNPTIPAAKPTVTDPLSVELTFKANDGYTFDNSIIEGKKYQYTASSGSAVATAKLTLKISPQDGSWTD